MPEEYCLKWQVDPYAIAISSDELYLAAGLFVSDREYSHDEERCSYVAVWCFKSGEINKVFDTLGQKKIDQIGFSPDCSKLAASVGKYIILWDLNSHSRFCTLQGHTDWIQSMIFSHDSTWLVSLSGGDCTCKVWDTTHGEFLGKHTIVPGKHNMKETTSITLSPDSSKALAANFHHSQYTSWRIGDEICLIASDFGFHGPRFPFRSTLSHDTTYLAQANFHNSNIEIWDWSTNEYIQTLEGEGRGRVRRTYFSHDSKQLIVLLKLELPLSELPMVKIWDLATGLCIHTLELPVKTELNRLAVSRNSPYLVASYDKTVKIWDMNSGACINTLDDRPVFDEYVEQLRLAITQIRNPILLAISEWNRDGGRSNIRILDVVSGECLYEFRSRIHREICFDASGSYLLSWTGTIDIQASSLAKTVQHRGLSIQRTDKGWIMYNSRKLLWLPPEYRPGYFHIKEDVIAISAEGGSIWVLDFKLDRMDW